MDEKTQEIEKEKQNLEVLEDSDAPQDVINKSKGKNTPSSTRKRDIKRSTKCCSSEKFRWPTK